VHTAEQADQENGKDAELRHQLLVPQEKIYPDV
jgi:hypothetical protein